MLRDGIILIIGVTGDLSKRKLIPALYDLFIHGLLGKTRLVGAALEPWDKLTVLAASHPFIKEVDGQIWQAFTNHFEYCQLNICDPNDFSRLSELLAAERDKYGLSPQILVYCAVFERLYLPLTHQLVAAGIVRRSSNRLEAECRVVYEKPFGHDYDSVQILNRTLLTELDETQIYRVDHYLAKEMVSQIVQLRFVKKLFEPFWNNAHIDSVYIILDEELGVEGRSLYYEQYGAVRDMVQNHALQILSLIGMERPKSFSGNDLSDAKFRVLKTVKIVDGILGQYHGYLDQPGVDPDSQIPTFAVLRMLLNTERWQGVPFYIRTGKKLQRKQNLIRIKFKSLQLLPIFETKFDLLEINIDPESTIRASLEGKILDSIKGLASSISPHLQDYAKIFNSIMQGESGVSVSIDEIEAAWQIADQIIEHNLPLYRYQPLQNGPLEMQAFNQKYNLAWD